METTINLNCQEWHLNFISSFKKNLSYQIPCKAHYFTYSTEWKKKKERIKFYNFNKVVMGK